MCGIYANVKKHGSLEIFGKAGTIEHSTFCMKLTASVTGYIIQPVVSQYIN